MHGACLNIKFRKEVFITFTFAESQTSKLTFEAGFPNRSNINGFFFVSPRNENGAFCLLSCFATLKRYRLDFTISISYWYVEGATERYKK